MKFMLPTVYRVTQNDLYARLYTSMWAPDLRQRIIEAVELITLQILINTWQELEYRLYMCRATTGATLKCTDMHKNVFELLCTLL
jgi:hypothetical protein